MPTRTVLALIVAPLAATFVYALALVATTTNVPVEVRPSLVGGIVIALAVGLVFEVVALLPLALVVRTLPRGRIYLFLGGSLIWLAVSLVFSLRAMGWFSAVATTVQLLPPGIVLVAVFAALVKLRQRA
jgi:hypothetical protein